MITLDDVMPLVLEACPAFLPVLEAYYRRYDVIPGSRPFYYIEAVKLTSWLDKRVESQETACFPTLFTLIERLLAEGTNQVRDLAAVGIIEGLQNVAYNRRGSNAPLIYVPWLGPLARKEWDAYSKDGAVE